MSSIAYTQFTSAELRKIVERRHHSPFLTVYKQFRNDAFDTDTRNLMRGARVGNACPSRVAVHKTGTVYSNPVADIFRRSETIARYSGHQTRWARGTRSIAKASMANVIADRRYDKYAADSCRFVLARSILIDRDINFLQR